MNKGLIFNAVCLAVFVAFCMNSAKSCSVQVPATKVDTAAQVPYLAEIPYDPPKLRLLWAGIDNL